MRPHSQCAEKELKLYLTEDEDLLLRGYCQRYGISIEEFLMNAVREAMKIKNKVE